MTNKIHDKIIKKLGIENLIELLVNRLSFGELHSLLLKIFELKIVKKNYSDILNEYQSNRFTKPSDIDPIIQKKLELNIFSLLPREFKLVELSPLAPLGTTSVLTNTHQNNVVSTIRNAEIAADNTNILALECAKRRIELFKKDKQNRQTIKLCSSQRLTRAQLFDNKNFSAHFNVIALCSAGKDEGNDNFEIFNIEEHIKFYIDILEKIIDKNEITIINIKFFNYEEFDNSSIIGRVKNQFNHLDYIKFKIENDSDFGKNYYTRLRFMISIVNQNNQEFDYIDGGFTDWTRKLLSNKKERLLTSGIGTDYLLRTVKIKTSANNK